ncbi:HAD family hydrolase [Vagococcus hydrophili]|uniref:HAD family hydrolase n=1 Tax=Vagococcus hydrophili TaxID=2714947 RepID=A0A6G8ATP5_9ENTE|nr:HAD family hydrolase [Vagococcus hydrophili]QIL48434.1 HAD family hydrolase [Vagococcus hydrophili]
MNKKLIAFDIDGTLINDEHAILPETLAAITQLQNEGHMVMCATGRSLPLAEEVLNESGIEHAVLSNGAVAFSKGEQIYSNPLNREAMLKLVKVSAERKIDLVFNGLKETKLNNPNYNPETKIAMESFGQALPEIDETFHERAEVYQIVALLDESKMDAYVGKFPEFRFVRWHEHGIDVLPHNGSKAETLKFVADKFGFAQADIMAFGDGNNDMEMLAYAGVGVAMGNGKEDLKAVSDFVTLSNNEGGIVHALKEYNLIQ